MGNLQTGSGMGRTVCIARPYCGFSGDLNHCIVSGEVEQEIACKLCKKMSAKCLANMIFSGDRQCFVVSGKVEHEIGNTDGITDTIEVLSRVLGF